MALQLGVYTVGWAGPVCQKMYPAVTDFKQCPYKIKLSCQDNEHHEKVALHHMDIDENREEKAFYFDNLVAVSSRWRLLNIQYKF